MVARLEDGTHRDVIAKVLDRDRTSVNHYERLNSLLIMLLFLSIEIHLIKFTMLIRKLKTLKYTFKDYV